ncbi:inhibitor/lipid-transfer protein/seed storage 2S albumin superfamily protein (DUF784) [Arabidopsis thaliana]|uniref:Inhibitor/lipid-transfer protein/seed storage 2S albumin superfamily protein (DUF784) n=1 Tax=Arabidopsis thaliana TaxID=3702 RepID=A8MQ82_ARATH|nr:inhibitor/lipid-transfer protein/seed storage 2S albumin superfamily protein (DUF784) [Arabidopsis thaliana]NP_001078229.1 inhibitor/lipid-transfer protein/seed storage 2S albumin superfamily protein (DUF784) [Arabidopsis thaliana]AEE77642.1 inhibitor/lipid-transfer protein/seed storage 2S albumin superfamily protein (DUF784) [Arabidopsis thaliana]AEE77643.1 inhibitor/lipid-transfer protein/seed storage 2S albumin superfamily protein (DUF784) [Arabidopsis thaliana]|eukprot:NP_001078228.1 inhibitor/lipid-transfer protein/seed storage 2S albumin superfamily protein (DUF784) [Arabidopsis thaliana]
MSKFNSQITMLFIVLALVCAFVPAFSAEEAEANLLWKTCLVKITPKCALDIIAAVFENGTMPDPCCNDLVKEGKVCHDTLIKYIADKPMLIAHETEYLKKSDDLWKHCFSISESA